MFKQIDNVELDAIFEEISDKIQYSVDTGEEIDGIVNIKETTFSHLTREYTSEDKQYEIQYNIINIDKKTLVEKHENDEYLEYYSSILLVYGFRNENSFPIKIKYKLIGCDLQMDYYESYIEPNEISFILAGYPVNFIAMLNNIIKYKISIDDSIDLTDINEIHLSSIGCSIRRENVLFLAHSHICYITNENYNLISSQIMKNIMFICVAGTFFVISDSSDNGLNLKEWLYVDKYEFKSNVLSNSYANRKYFLK